MSLPPEMLRYNAAQPRVQARVKAILGDALDYVVLHGNDLQILLNDSYEVSFAQLKQLSTEFGTDKINFEWESGEDLSDVTPGSGPMVWIEILGALTEADYPELSDGQ
jgi:hypothetical protein